MQGVGEALINVVQGAGDMLKTKLRVGNDLLAEEDRQRQAKPDNAPAGAASEAPGTEPSTQPLADNAGIETAGAVADETAAAERRQAAAPEHGMPSIAPHVLASDSPTQADDTLTAQNTAANAAGGPAAAAGGEEGVVDRHEELLTEEEQRGKIFKQEPMLPGAGVAVHGMLPAPILMHATQNTKRTGGSYKEAITGVPVPEHEKYTSREEGGENPYEPGLPAEMEAPSSAREDIRPTQ